jgi:drug/metabolite transporter (DMT)-like permease
VSSPAERALIPVVLVVAVLAVSAAGPLVVIIDDAEPVAIALWRTLLVAVLFLPGLRRVGARDLGWIVLSGIALAGHFALWFESLDHTSVMRSTVLVALNPAWAGAIEWAFLRDRPPWMFWAGLVGALVGVALMTTAEPVGSASWVGDAEALVAGMLGAIYLVIGRHVRQRVGIGSYGCLVAAFAAATLLPTALANGTPIVGWSWTTWAILVALALGPQTLGHNGFNWLLRHLPAASVSAATLLEPVGATLIAAVLLSQLPTPVGAVGALIIVASVMTAALSRATQTPTPAAPSPPSATRSG